jgi:hypothetical protein
LNAEAIASLEGELIGMTSNAAGLIGAMERSIGRANDFVRALGSAHAISVDG